jgi:hypothetical protein
MFIRMFYAHRIPRKNTGSIYNCNWKSLVLCARPLPHIFLRIGFISHLYKICTFFQSQALLLRFKNNIFENIRKIKILNFKSQINSKATNVPNLFDSYLTKKVLDMLYYTCYDITVLLSIKNFDNYLTKK